MEAMNIQWYPGHMAKTRRMIAEHMGQVDAVCEILDARIPISSRNPDVDGMVGSKPRVILLNRMDQADPQYTRLWTEYFRNQGYAVVPTDSRTGAGVSGFAPAVRELLKQKLEAWAASGKVGKKLRVMIIGIPNVGKSSFINRLAGRKTAKAEDRPGVTRGKQWITVDSTLEMLDTPGILWPKFDDQSVGLNLAYTGAVKDDILDLETLALNLCAVLNRLYPQALAERYRIQTGDTEDGWELLRRCAKRRGFLISGGALDTERMARILLDEYRSGKLGRITLEIPGDLDHVGV